MVYGVGSLMPTYCDEHKMFHERDPFECDRMRADADRARMDAERRAHAERIAADTYARHMPKEGAPVMRSEILDALTAAALQALTEKENAS